MNKIFRANFYKKIDFFYQNSNFKKCFFHKNFNNNTDNKKRVYFVDHLIIKSRNKMIELD